MCVKGTDLFLKHPVLSKFRLKTLGTPEHLRTNVHFADLRLSKRSTQHSRVLQILPKFRNKISFCFGIVFICLFSHEMKTMRIEWLERPLLRVWILRLETCVSWLARHTDVTPSHLQLGSSAFRRQFEACSELKFECPTPVQRQKFLFWSSGWTSEREVTCFPSTFKPFQASTCSRRLAGTSFRQL